MEYSKLSFIISFLTFFFLFIVPVLKKAFKYVFRDFYGRAMHIYLNIQTGKDFELRNKDGKIFSTVGKPEKEKRDVFAHYMLTGDFKLEK